MLEYSSNISSVSLFSEQIPVKSDVNLLHRIILKVAVVI